jgi:hypothetical protein
MQIGSHLSQLPEVFEALSIGMTEGKYKARVRNIPPVQLQLRQ